MNIASLRENPFRSRALKKRTSIELFYRASYVSAHDAMRESLISAMTRLSFMPHARAHRARLFLQLAAVSLMCASIFVAGCGKKKHRVNTPARINSVETGIASWYGYPYHGRRAANGEIYDMEQMPAAHRTLPFGTWVEVHDLDNDRKVTVRITDRGPFIDGRIIDLSKAAAREIAMIGPGIAKVRLKVVAQPASLPQVSQYAVQAGAFQDKGRAETLRRRLADQYGTARLVFRPGNPSVWRVLVGSEPTLDRANELQDRIRQTGLPAFVVRLDEPEPASTQSE
jgi:rare lipoprotein A